MAANRGKYNCQACTFGHHCDDSNPAPYPKWVIVGVESRTCPLPMVSEFSSAMLKLYGHYKRQHLPFPGGILAQPSAYIQSMEILEGAFDKMAREE